MAICSSADLLISSRHAVVACPLPAPVVGCRVGEQTTGKTDRVPQSGSPDPSSNSHHERMEASCPLRRLEAWKPNRLYSQPQDTKERTDSYS